MQQGSKQNTTQSAEDIKVTRKNVRQRRFIRSLAGVTMLRYAGFAAIILVILWAAFFIGMYWFYDDVAKDDLREVGANVAGSLPKPLQYNTDMHLKYRLADIARRNSVAIFVFSRVDDENTVCMTVDSLGDDHSDGSDLFEAVMSELNAKDACDKQKDVHSIATDYGDYICYVDYIGNWDTDGVAADYFFIVIKPYDIYNSQTLKILYMFVICTIIVLGVSVGFAFFASRSQVKKLREFSQQAKQIADGDHNVKFTGDGYSEYESLANALNAATESMEKAESMQRDLTANVSHDIRTPITMIRASAEMLRDMPLEGEKREKTANVIISEADKLTLLTDDILSMSKLQSGVTEFKFEECDISEIATMTLCRFDILKTRDGVVFNSDIDKKLIVSCDKQRIEQVLYNLIANAVNYRGADNIVELSVKQTENRARVEVSDHGDGIAEEEISYIWDKYYRSAHSKRTKIGSGLGLSICKSILSAHDAKFGVVSELGKGSTFWFELELVGQNKSKHDRA